MALTYPHNITLYQVGDAWVQADMNLFLAALDRTYCGALYAAFDPIYLDPTNASYDLPASYNSSDYSNHKLTNVISVSCANYEAASRVLRTPVPRVSQTWLAGCHNSICSRGFRSCWKPRRLSLRWEASMVSKLLDVVFDANLQIRPCAK
jgi:hypothetical protein